MWADYARRRAALYRDHHHLTVGGAGYISDRYCQYNRHAHGGLSGQTLFEEISIGRDISGPHGDRRAVHCPAHHPNVRGNLLLRDGLALAGHCAAHLRLGRSYLWAALYGHALWDCVLLAPTGQLSGRLAWRQDV